MKKEDTSYNLQIAATPAKSLKGVSYLLFVDPSKVKAYSEVNECFYNPKMEKILNIVKGEPNELYLHAILPKDHVFNLFDNQDSTIDQFMSAFCGLPFISRSYAPAEQKTSQRLSNGITLYITRKADGATNIHCCVYLISDAQLNFLSGDSTI